MLAFSKNENIHLISGYITEALKKGLYERAYLEGVCKYTFNDTSLGYILVTENLLPSQVIVLIRLLNNYYLEGFTEGKNAKSEELKSVFGLY